MIYYYTLWYRFLELKAITASPVPSQITCSLPKPPARDRKYARQVRAQVPGRPRSASVYQTKFGSMDSNLISKLVQQVRWTPTSRAAAEEMCLKFPQVCQRIHTICTKCIIPILTKWNDSTSVLQQTNLHAVYRSFNIHFSFASNILSHFYFALVFPHERIIIPLIIDQDRCLS